MRMVYDVEWNQPDPDGKDGRFTCRAYSLEEAIRQADVLFLQYNEEVLGLRIRPTIHLEGIDPVGLERYGL